MKEYVFFVSGLPNSTFHQPMCAKLVLSDIAVATGIANAADIVSLRITAGAAIPDSNPITFNDLHSQFLNPRLTLSADGKSVKSFSAERNDGFKYNYWVFYQSFHQIPTVGRVENIVTLNPKSIKFESDLNPPPTEIHCSLFTGNWKRVIKIFPPRISPHYLAIDPLALVLSSEIYVKLHLPDPPPVEAVQEYIRESIKGMSTKQKAEARDRIRTLKAFTEAMEKELETRQKGEE